MSQNENSLLIRIKGDAAGGKAAIAETRAAIASLRSSSGTDFAAMQSASAKTFGQIEGHLTNFVGRVPGGGVFLSLTEGLRGMATQSDKVTPAFRSFNKSLDDLSKTTGKSSGELAKFLAEFVKIPNAAERGAAGYIAFGSKFDELEPKLEAAGKKLVTVATETEAAGASLGALAHPVGLAVVAVAAAVIEFGILGKVLFELSRAAADFRGKLFDLSQQTGVAVETLNALDIVTSKTGSSLNSITSSLVLFQTKLDEAQDPMSEAGQRFKELGISTLDTESALRSAFEALAKMPVGFEQTNAAAELFGRRGAKQVLAILKETKGDVDNAVTSLGQLARVTKEQSQLADDFNDALKNVDIIMRGIVATLGSQILPQAIAGLNAFRKTLTDNEQSIKALATVIEILSRLITTPLKGAFDVAIAAGNVLNPILKVTAEYYERIAVALQIISGRGGVTVDPNAIPALTNTGASLVPQVGVDISANLPGPKGVFKSAIAASTAQAQRELELERSLREALRLEFEQRNSDLNEHFERQTRLVDLHYATLTGQIARERVAIQAGYEQGAIDAAEAEKQKADLDLRATEAKNQRAEETARLAFELRKGLDKQEIEFRERSFALLEAQRRGELARFAAALERQAIDESELLTKQLEFLKAAHKERIGIIDFELKALSTSTERKKELDNEKKIAEQEYTDEFKRLTNERINTMNAESAAREGRPESTFSGDDIDPNAIGKIIEGIIGLPPVLIDTSDAFGALGKQISDVFGLGREGAEIFGGLMTNAFGMLAQAVGEAVHAFVLFGGAGIGIKKFTATMIAEIARMATVQAVWELAQGFAMLAMNFFWPDPRLAASATAHFHAAAIYGGLGAVAAAVGRGVAGGSFADTGGGGSGTGGGNAGRNPSDGPSTIEVDRRRGSQTAAQPQGMTFTLTVPQGWLGDELRKDYNLNGYSRLLIKSGD